MQRAVEAVSAASVRAIYAGFGIRSTPFCNFISKFFKSTEKSTFCPPSWLIRYGGLPGVFKGKVKAEALKSGDSGHESRESERSFFTFGG